MKPNSLDLHPALNIMSETDDIRRFLCKNNGNNFIVVMGSGSDGHYFVSINPEEVEREGIKFRNEGRPNPLNNNEIFRYYPNTNVIEYRRSMYAPILVGGGGETTVVLKDVKMTEQDAWMLQTLNSLYKFLSTRKEISLFG